MKIAIIGTGYVGLVTGTLFGVGLTLAGVPRLGGIHVGVVGLGLNVAIAIGGSLLVASDRKRGASA